MKLIGKIRLSRIVECCLVGLLILVPILVVSLPWSITWITERAPSDPYYIRYFVILAYSGVMGELILWQARGILHNVNVGKVFSSNTVHRMRTMAVEFLVLSAFYLATMFWMSKFFMAFLFVCFVLVGCSLFVFAELFAQANEYKSENDMTI